MNNIADKDKLIIVCYVDVSNIDPPDVGVCIYEYSNYLKNLFDDTVIVVVLPSKHTKIEAVNPILISSEDLKNQFTDIILKLNENLKHLKLK